MDKVSRLISENRVVVFSKSTCCMCYAVSVLFHDIGVTPFVFELDQDHEGREMEKTLAKMVSKPTNALVPAVFIGGKFVGSTNEVMSLHLSGSLLPMLKPCQANIS